MRRFRLVIWILSALAAMAIPAASTAQIISITIAPPELPVYEQPEIPAPGYIWTPGYWAYGPDGYFWVPGTWVEPPAVGLLWTPGYWGWHPKTKAIRGSRRHPGRLNSTARVVSVAGKENRGLAPHRIPRRPAARLLKPTNNLGPTSRQRTSLLRPTERPRPTSLLETGL